MRTFLYAMPSSGATFIAWTMCQSVRILGLLDYCQGRLPTPNDLPGRFDVILKDTVGSGRSFAESLKTFKPDRVVLVTKDRTRIRESLIRRYSIADNPGRFLRGGLEGIDGCFRIFDKTLSLNQHDAVVSYEDIAARKPDLPRSLLDIAIQNHVHSAWCRQNALPVRWAFGGIHHGDMSQREIMFLYRTVRYYGSVLSGHTKWRHIFAHTGMYVPALR